MRAKAYEEYFGNVKVGPIRECAYMYEEKSTDSQDMTCREQFMDKIHDQVDKYRI